MRRECTTASAVLTSNPNVATDNVIVRDLTCDANWAEISTTADTGDGGEKNIKTGAVVIWGSNNLIERVRSINSYGSWANRQEQFVFYMGGREIGRWNRTTLFNSVAQNSPYGNYGKSICAGWMGYTYAVPSLTDSRVVSCYCRWSK